MRVAYPDSSIFGSKVLTLGWGLKPTGRDWTCRCVDGGGSELQEWRLSGWTGGRWNDLKLLWEAEKDLSVLGLTVAGWITAPEVTLYTPMVGDWSRIVWEGSRMLLLLREDGTLVSASTGTWSRLLFGLLARRRHTLRPQQWMRVSGIMRAMRRARRL